MKFKRDAPRGIPILTKKKSNRFINGSDVAKQKYKKKTYNRIENHIIFLSRLKTNIFFEYRFKYNLINSNIKWPRIEDVRGRKQGCSLYLRIFLYKVPRKNRY